MTKSRAWPWWHLVIAAAALPAVAAGPPPPGRPKARLRVADAARLEVKAHWGPITESEWNFHKRWKELRDLRPAQARATYGAADFRALLPTGPVAPGELWELSDKALLKFLRQLHPGARLKLHINNGDSRGGGYGCLRAFDDRRADVMFRAHAEFALREGVFTPGQFAGRLVLDRSTGKVVYFRLHLPPSPVNVDLGWRMVLEARVKGKMHRTTQWFADAGSVSRLELVGGEESAPRAAGRLPGRAAEEVSAAFARRFYRFQGINWVDFDKAAAAARRTGRPLHVVALNGALGDESC
jgi:hypothetical protein